jgi:hypothetical protein
MVIKDFLLSFGQHHLTLKQSELLMGPESFHTHLNEQFYTCHPSIFVFVDVLLQLQTTSYIKMRTLSIKATVRKNEREKMDFVVEQYTKHANGELSTVDFVRSVGYKYAARTDI